MLQILTPAQKYLSQNCQREFQNMSICCSGTRHFQVFKSKNYKYGCFQKSFVCFYKCFFWIRLIWLIANNWPNFLDPRGDSAIPPHGNMKRRLITIQPLFRPPQYFSSIFYAFPWSSQNIYRLDQRAISFASPRPCTKSATSRAVWRDCWWGFQLGRFAPAPF